MINQLTATIQIISKYPDRTKFDNEMDWKNEIAIWLEELALFTSSYDLSVEEQKMMIEQINKEISDINNMSLILNGLANYKGDWTATYNNGLGYGLADSVTYNNINYVSKIDNNTDMPPSSNWQNLTLDVTLKELTKIFTTNEEYEIQLDQERTLAKAIVFKQVSDENETNTTLNVDVGEYEQSGTDLTIDINSISILQEHNIFDISNSSYDNISKSVSAQEINPRALALADNDTKMYIAGNTNDTVYQYNLSTAGVVSTANYIGSKSVASEASSPYGIALSTDGTKMYVLDNGDGQLHQYTLSTTFVVSTATYDGIFNNLADAGPSYQRVGLEFSDDGLNFYILTESNIIYQYTLSTAWDLSTASYSGNTLDVSSQSTSAQDMTISPNGTEMCLLGGSSIYKYTLSTAWDISEATYETPSFSVSTQDSNAYGLASNFDGTKFYILGPSNDTVYQYSMENFTYKDSEYISCTTTGLVQIDTSLWTEINSITISETLNSQTIFYSFSTDAETTYKICTAAGERNIVRNNNEIFEYNSDATFASETWTSASANDKFTALSEAMTVAANNMTSSTLDVSALILGDTFDMSAILYTNSSTATPVYEGIEINYDGFNSWQEATSGTDYTSKQIDDFSKITFTSLKDQTLKIRVI